MNEIKLFFTVLLQELEDGHDVMAVTIIESLGAAPRGAGARMLAGQRGRVFGTIGGGPVEYRAELEAVEFLVKKVSAQRRYDLSDSSKEVGMICGGAVTAAFHYIGADREDVKKLCRRALEYLSRPTSLWLILELPRPLSGNLEEDKAPLYIGIRRQGENCYPDGFPNPANPASVPAAAGERCDRGEAGIFTAGEKTYYLEPVAADSLVHIFGGGHVARELAPLLIKTGFACAIYDDREDFLKEEDFPGAAGTAAISFDRLDGCLFPSAKNYFVIMTRGHQFDLEAQAFAMKTPNVYIGVMGSRKKTAALTGRLLEMGFSREALERVHAPIGLNIGAETPAEIAVSIAAELIQTRKNIQSGGKS